MTQLQQFLSDAFVGGLLPLILLGAVPAFLLALVTGKSASRLDKTVIVAMGMVGASIGVMLGASRQPVVTVALPAILTLVSTFLAYVYAKEKAAPEKQNVTIILKSVAENKMTPEQGRDAINEDQGQVRFIPVIIIAFVLTASMSSFYGSSIRRAEEMRDRDYAEWLFKFQNIEVPINKEVLRRKLGLPGSVPAEATQTEPG
mgnify:CR=1 FL=1|tara:strand:+ start:3957 stop:4562 length:606 start_codon:yes stop_codon:yes gene_type:complete